MDQRQSYHPTISNVPFRCFFLVLLSSLCSLCLPISAINSSGPCPRSCGALQVPYPFGMGNGCFKPGFEVSCIVGTRHSSLFISGTGLQILNISNGQVLVDSSKRIASDCADQNRTVTDISLPETGPFTISDASNSFTAIGCDTVAVVTDENSRASGCVSLCTTLSSVVNGSCSGAGCCESSIPKWSRYLGLGASSMFGYKNVSSFSNCSFAFVVERGRFEFKENDLQDFTRRTDIAMILDWAIGSENCSNHDHKICGENSFCVDSKHGFGYLCNCSDGYAGNPYINGSRGCQDINECLSSETTPCVPTAHCRNKIPGFKCICPFGNRGDGTRSGSGCKNYFQVLEAVIGTGLGFIVLLLCSVWYYCALKKRTSIKLKEQFFRQNGGLFLKQQVSSREDSPRIFSSEELKHATENYNESRILGAGGYGTVYKGILEDGTVVAIKKSKVIDKSQIDQFINEVVILTQINHRNVVKLLGCCLETEVPMLVYEFIPNGTLYNHIHESHASRRITWPNRLRIAVETAEALSYLHSAASVPIFHRDVKSANILLDEHYTAKVSDFGISRLVPINQSQIPTLVQGTLGYLDPEYFQTSQLTEKSDVYSFGVVLVELLTGEKPVSLERSQESSNLAMYFLSSLRKKVLQEFLNDDVLREGDDEQLMAVAELARKCLLLKGDKRPTMKEVAQELALIAGSRRKRNAGIEEEEEEEEEEEDTILRERALVLFGEQFQEG